MTLASYQAFYRIPEEVLITIVDEVVHNCRVPQVLETLKSLRLAHPRCAYLGKLLHRLFGHIVLDAFESDRTAPVKLALDPLSQHVRRITFENVGHRKGEYAPDGIERTLKADAYWATVLPDVSDLVASWSPLLLHFSAANAFSTERDDYSVMLLFTLLTNLSIRPQSLYIGEESEPMEYLHDWSTMPCWSQLDFTQLQGLFLRFGLPQYGKDPAVKSLEALLPRVASNLEQLRVSSSDCLEWPKLSAMTSPCLQSLELYSVRIDGARLATWIRSCKRPKFLALYDVRMSCGTASWKLVFDAIRDLAYPGEAGFRYILSLETWDHSFVLDSWQRPDRTYNPQEIPDNPNTALRAYLTGRCDWPPSLDEYFEERLVALAGRCASEALEIGEARIIRSSAASTPLTDQSFTARSARRTGALALVHSEIGKSGTGWE
ncbi:hypothetical protein CBER1_05215 [Cercospora berteroae]|uniref:Uncharacterized protein n=1 Tax=Cercospora berteroae TaxID=357750 RepID=A0A2S6BRW2_9PEZI|nr:hypothetical protein CBER1_05215 [Cercospora berteroae]